TLLRHSRIQHLPTNIRYAPAHSKQPVATSERAQRVTARRSRNQKGRSIGVSAYRGIGVNTTSRLRATYKACCMKSAQKNKILTYSSTEGTEQKIQRDRKSVV